MLEGPWPWTSFVLFSLTMYELDNRNASIGWLYEHTKPPFVFNLAGFVQDNPPPPAPQRTLPGFLAISFH